MHATTKQSDTSGGPKPRWLAWLLVLAVGLVGVSLVVWVTWPRCDEDFLLDRLEQLEVGVATNAEVRALIGPTAEALDAGCAREPKWIKQEIADVFSDGLLLVEGAPDSARQAACGGTSSIIDFESCGFGRYLALTPEQYEALERHPSPDLWVVAWGFEELGVPRALLRRYFRLLVLAYDARHSTPDAVVAHPHVVVMDEAVELPLTAGRLTPQDADRARARIDRMEYDSTLSLSIANDTRPSDLRWLKQVRDEPSVSLSLVSTRRSKDGLPVRAEVEIVVPRPDTVDDASLSEQSTRCVIVLAPGGWWRLDVGGAHHAEPWSTLESALTSIECGPRVWWDPQLDAGTMMLALSQIYANEREPVRVVLLEGPL